MTEECTCCHHARTHAIQGQAVCPASKQHLLETMMLQCHTDMLQRHVATAAMQPKHDKCCSALASLPVLTLPEGKLYDADAVRSRYKHGVKALAQKPILSCCTSGMNARQTTLVTSDSPRLELQCQMSQSWSCKRRLSRILTLNQSCHYLECLDT